MSEKMPEWPEGPGTIFGSLSPAAVWERARADAAMARLRVAVEALKAVQAESRSPDALWFEANYDKIAMDAIHAIGALPND